MDKFQCAHASATDWQEAAQMCLQQLGKTDEATLGFLYVTDTLSEQVPDILNYFKQHTKLLYWVGAVGIGICSVNTEYFDMPAIAVMLGDFPEDSFSIFSTDNKKLNNFSRIHQSWCNIQKPIFALVHGDPHNKQMTKLIFEMSERLDDGFLVGGLSSARQQPVQIANAVCDGGLSGVLFSKRINVITQLTQGCAPLGPRHEITESTNNIIVRIDDRPALDVFKEDIGTELAADLDKIAGNIFAALPILGSDIGDYLVRNIIGIDPKHKLLAIGDKLTAGMPIMFTHRQPDLAKKDFIKMLKTLKRRLKGQKPKGGFYHSCVGRGKSLFGNNSEEVKMIQDILGDFPMIGFFANGEIYYQRLYGYSGIVTLFLDYHPTNTTNTISSPPPNNILKS
ncbi:MAG: FIST C-terminal domain-containing protein [Thiomargarita sp.]|nr:FIST C-terminal domain-containing protein [Thiomargarita sp.]